MNNLNILSKYLGIGVSKDRSIGGSKYPRIRVSKYHTLILTTVFLGAFLSGCSDDLEVREGINDGFDGNLTLKINIPESDIVETRAEADHTADEKALNVTGNHYAFMFNQDGSLYQQFPISISDTKNTEEITVSKSLNLNTIKMVVVANAPAAINDVTDYNGLLSKLTASSTAQPAKYFVMSGIASSSGPGTYTVNLQRSVAKVSLSASASNFTLTGYTMYNMPTQGFYTAAAASEDNQSDAYIFKTGTSSYKVTGATGANYTYPVKSLGNSVETSAAGAGAYIVVEGKYNNETCFYRVDLRNETTSGYYNFEPNHWYQVEIVEVLRKGYTTATEAAKRYMGQENEIVVKIHDHAANVLSMVTDGLRELGVTREVTMTANASSTFTVKCYSGAPNNTAEENEKPVIKIKSGSDWLKIPNAASPAEVTPATSETSGNQSGDTDNPGKRWKYTMDFVDASKIFNDKTAIVEVTWQGLTREMEVYYNADFTPEEACGVTLYFKYRKDQAGNLSNQTGTTNAATQVTDYWTYLKSTVKGIDTDAMADGKVRNEGLHFSMPYAEGDSQWAYVYDINFSKSQAGSVTITDITFSTSGDKFFDEDNINFVYTTVSGVPHVYLGLKNPKLDDFTYAVGSIDFIITYNDGSERVLSMSLYHTGFFNASDNLYYEVVNLGGYYWLDRNLGAQSNMMYVNDEATNPGNPDAAGNIYKIANKGTNYGDPTWVYTSITHLPPGYRVPNSTDWDAIRLSPNFTSSQVTEGGANYTATYYEIGDNDKGGRIYFPKSRFYNQTSELATGVVTKSSDEANAGDDGSGYYWTTTVSSGLEKDEIGNWLQALNLSGASNTYISGSIKNHLMSVRCIAKVSHASEVRNAIEFNVKGATHVYLYTVDNSGNKSGIFTFPGKAIGSESAVKVLDYSYSSSNYKNSYLHFSYTSTIPVKDEAGNQQLFVFFAYRTDKGDITIISRNKSQTLAGATGWPVIVGYNYFFNKDASFNPMYESSTSTTFPWPASGSSVSESNYYYVEGKSVTLKWYKKPYGVSTEYNRAYVWFPDNSKPLGEWNGQAADSNDGTYFYKTFTVSSDADKFNVIFTAGDSSNQTSTITVGKTNGSSGQTTYTLQKDGSGNVTVEFGNYYKQ